MPAASSVVRSVIGGGDDVDVEEVRAMKLEMKRAIAEAADASNQAQLNGGVGSTSVALGSPRVDGRGGAGAVSPVVAGAVVGIAAAAAVAIAGASRRGRETETGEAERVPLIGGQDAV